MIVTIHILSIISSHIHYKVSVSVLFWSAFSRIRTEYGEMQCISPYSVQMRENADQNNSDYGHFSGSSKCYEQVGHIWQRFN